MIKNKLKLKGETTITREQSTALKGLLICLDTEEGTRADIDREYKEYLAKNKVNPQGVNVVIWMPIRK